MADYIKMIRGLVGHTPIILNTAAGVVLNAEHEVLLNLRADTHNWSLPGGFLEYGETYAQACVREVKEDSGLEVEVVRLLATFDEGTVAYPNGDVAQTITQLFLTKPVGGNLLETKTNETLALEYFPFSQLPPLLNKQTEEMLKFAEKNA
ncbi:NUDIX hydrolase [Liquorilactobacillus satsumensis]|uniref:NTP pyrophosphohydrolase n=1 Tax=Liquorilactobacillus satsumensis DSM 16230 = JCM 12392 TaxID=1423801 RepID=A0A0R1V609_9LACO|nr:NUDIX hydrolase [Liquorilactobacillus satsumensis]KRL98792.1 NTP pyrophosphohydrolase [Liquorilactobacillus satsumensis DSM 16230 = JCM 12392]MCC7666378.1 NUDIX domain-containing protein [Liquorilactobacillus satsumensis]MCP9313098.1 NUDIX hydrolase [Liquorilactobacillus satsumensis]MCP9328030.1 NUDIX hydrolase [Liquorilactobacillus satsumensis]MCP9358344.1 NUDIX hydrolase [Liquorilactobacillus satsumensis]